jgi:hypothetical protein
MSAHAVSSSTCYVDPFCSPFCTSVGAQRFGLCRACSNSLRRQAQVLRLACVLCTCEKELHST